MNRLVGLRSDLFATVNDRRTAMAIAAQSGYEKMVDKIVALHLDLLVITTNGCTRL